MRNESKKNEKKGKKDRKGGERKIKRGWEKSEALISAKRRYIFDIFKNKIRADEREKRERKREEKKRREKEKRERERRKNKGEKRKKKEKATPPQNSENRKNTGRAIMMIDIDTQEG